MMKHKLTRPALGMFAAGAVLVTASVAWACTVEAYLTLSQYRGASGTSVTVHGTNFPWQGSATIHWNSTGAKPIGTAVGENWSVAVKVPGDAAPGTYYIVAVGYDRDGAVVGKASEAFAVTGAPSDSENEKPGATSGTVSGGESQQRGSGHTSGTTSAGDFQQSATNSRGPGTGETSATASAGEQQPAAGQTRATASAGGQTVARDNSRANNAASSQESAGVTPGSTPGMTKRRAETQKPAAFGVSTTDSGQRVFNGSLPRKADSSGAPMNEEARRLRRAPAADAPSVAAVSNDLFSGFAQSEMGPGLLDSAIPAGRGRQLLTAGLALAAAGLFALSAGTAVVSVRRRRRATAS